MASNTTTADHLGESHYFYEDEVLKFDKNGRVKFGLVLESYEANGSETESEYEDSVKKGEIRVCWHSEGSEEVIEERCIGLADRTLMPGNVVRRITPGKDTQKGYCREVSVSADVQIKGTSFVIKNVLSERFHPLESIARDDVVCLDSFVGSTKTVQIKIVLKTPCGARVEVRPCDRQIFKLRDPDSKHRNGHFSSTMFYPGQTLVGSINSLENEKWLTPKPYNPRLECRSLHRTTSFVVQSVDLEAVSVCWQCKASDNVEPKSDYKASQPNMFLTGHDLQRLKRLSLFDSSMLQINDMNYLKVEEGDLLNLTSKSQWRKERSTCYDNYKILHNQKLIEIQQKMKIVEPIEDKTLKFDGDKKINFPSKLKFCTVTVHNAKLGNNYDMFDATKKHLDVIKKKLQLDDSSKKGIDSENGWKSDDEQDDDNSYSHSDITTPSSHCSTPTPRSSPKRSPLLPKKIKELKKRSNNKNQSNPPKQSPSIAKQLLYGKMEQLNR